MTASPGILSLDRAGYVVLERSTENEVFGGTPWPKVGDQAFFPPTDLMELDGIPRSYISQALRWSQANPEQWQVAYYLEVTVGWDCAPPPNGWTWLGFDVGEAVWNLRAGYSIIACECRPAQRLDAWWDTLNGHSLMPTIEATKGLIAARAERMRENPEGFEPYFGSGIRVYHVAVRHIPPPWRVPNRGARE